MTGSFGGYVPHTGGFFAVLGDAGLGILAQTPITDTAGQLYTLTYFRASKGTPKRSSARLGTG